MEVPRPTFGRIFFLEVQLNSQKILVKKKPNRNRIVARTERDLEKKRNAATLDNSHELE